MSSTSSITPGTGRGAPVAGPSLAARLGQRGVLARLAVLALLVAAVWLALAALTAVPDVVPATASPAVFSAERAMIDVRAQEVEPRTVGYAAHAPAHE